MIKFPELIQKFQQEMQEVDEAVHVLLKGHLLLEELLSKIIETFLFHREHFADAKFGFYHKIAFARSLCLRKDRFGEWDLLLAINSLRNELAHKLNSPKREAAVQRVKDLYFREAVDFPGINEIKEQQDPVILLYACTHCAGFLAKFGEDAKAFRKMVHAMDREINHDLPAFDE